MSLAAFAEPRQSVVLSPESRKTIPFDYTFRFALNGEKTRNVAITNTLTVSVEAAFTAVSIGYGAIPAIETIPLGPKDAADVETSGWQPSLNRFSFAQSSPALSKTIKRVLPDLDAARTALLAAEKAVVTGITTLTELSDAQKQELLGILLDTPRRLNLGSIVNSLGRALGEKSFVEHGEIGPQTAAALEQGIRLNPAVAQAFLLDHASGNLDLEQIGKLFVTVGAARDLVLFLYALSDEGTGRSFQSEPLLNLAGLGIADGDRPFRHFAQPIIFAPRTTIRMDVTPKTDFVGELYVALHGYKVLGGPGTPTGRAIRKAMRSR